MLLYGFSAGYRACGLPWQAAQRSLPVSSLRLRGNTRPCYNVVEISGSHVDIWRRHPFHGQERIIQFSTDTFEYEKYTGRIESEVTTRS